MTQDSGILFNIALGKLDAAAGTVSSEAAYISGQMSAVRTEFAALHTAWDSPSGQSFDDVATWFDHVSGELDELLAEIGRRLKTSYDNYAHAEQGNKLNLTGSQSPSSEEALCRTSLPTTTPPPSTSTPPPSTPLRRSSSSMQGTSSAL
ncbi:WXG100 family type VII secretion target [Streptomyces sp. NPDC001380]|uniref:WXG100 family type VII secretion target n=1 Tax=Streptomyces sp. NPDC001380 TaxID=3364566 RepID=UPI00369CD9B5